MCGHDGIRRGYEVFHTSPRVRVEKISPSVYLIRIDDEKIRFFEALWEIPEGVTYNAYIVTGPERIVLIDTVKRGFE
ncbi:MAG TPA: hypothetical protein EYP33_05930, partial [Pyrodictium sp.]|nr:hypothetical protein [Pyrodictium sp.]